MALPFLFTGEAAANAFACGQPQTQKKPHKCAALVFLLCDSVGIRTQDPQLRRLLLYPTELPNPIEECKDSTFFYFFKDLAINSIINTMEKPIAMKRKARVSWAGSPVRVSK